nr:MAG TPA: hypothetical protein [Caudoviricetes sp.]
MITFVIVTFSGSETVIIVRFLSVPSLCIKNRTAN